jgi:putative membrane protein
VLLFIVLSSLIFEKKPHWALLVFLLAGFFGFFTLDTGLFSDGILFPALSGLFGVSTLLLSLREKVQLPPQINSKISIKSSAIVKNSLLGSFAGMLVGLLPGVGAAQATYMTQQVSRKGSVKDFLVAVSGVNTANIIFTLVVLYAIGKMRSGIVVVINEIMSVLTFDYLLIFLAVILLAGGIAMFLHLKIGTFMAKWLSKKDPESYKKITIGVIVLVTVFVFLLTGFTGFLIMILGTAIGLIPPLVNVRRAECMAFLIFPVLLFYSGLNLSLLALLGI